MPDYNVRQLLAESDFWPNDLFDALYAKSRCGDELDRLTAAERAYFVADELLRETFMGGLVGYYDSPAGDHHREALAAMRAAGLDDYAALIEASFACWPDGLPPAGVADREEILLTWGPGDPMAERMEQIYSRWVLVTQDRYEVLQRFVEAHLDQFEGGRFTMEDDSSSG